MKKKIMLLIILLSIPMIVLAYKPGDKYIKGDADGSGKVTATDYIVLRKHILKQTTLKDDAYIRADVTVDNKITSLDYIAVRKMILNGKTREVVTVSGATSKSTATPTPKSTATATPKPSTKNLRQICKSNTTNEELINANEEVTIGMVVKNDKDWYINGGTDIVSITSGGTIAKIKKGELATIKGVNTGKVQIVVIKNNGDFARCNVYVSNNNKETGWKATTINGKLEWRYYDSEEKGYYKNGIRNIRGDYYYFDSNGIPVKNKEMTINGSKYGFNVYGQMLIGCVNGRYYTNNTNHDNNFGKYQGSCTDTSEYKKVNAKSISIESSKKTIGVGESLKLSVKLAPLNTNATTKWSSDNSNIVSVNSYGIIEGKNAGNAIITAKNGSKTATIKITVSGNYKISYKDGISADGIIDNSTFGIVKNGTSKKYARRTAEGINKALEKAKSLGFKEVKLEPGVYVIDVEHYGKNHGGITIPGGITFNLNGSVIKLYANNLYIYSMIVFSKNSSNAGIKNGTIEGDKFKHKCLDGTLLEEVRRCLLETSHEHGTGIRVYNAQNITIENMEIYNITGDGVNLGSDADSTKNITIKNNNIHNTRRQGVTVSCAENVTITNNILHDIYGNAPEKGIDLESLAGKNITKIKITNNKFYNNGYYYSGWYDILLATVGKICDVKITNNEFAGGIRRKNQYITNNCKANPPLEESNNKTITFK